MSIEKTDAGHKADRGRQAAVGHFLAILKGVEIRSDSDDETARQVSASEEVEITCDAQGHCKQPWRPLIDIIPPTPTRH